MSPHKNQHIDVSQQLGFLGSRSILLLIIPLLAVFVVWKQVECGRLRADIFKQQSRCASLLGENEQLSATRLSLSHFSLIRTQASEKLGMILPGTIPETIVASAADFRRAEFDLHWHQRKDGYACVR